MTILDRHPPTLARLHTVVVKARYEINSARSRLENQRIALTGALQYMEPSSSEALRCHKVIAHLTMLLEVFDMPEECLAGFLEADYIFVTPADEEEES